MHSFGLTKVTDSTLTCFTFYPGVTVFYLSLQIERWWRELHERLEKYFKVQLQTLKDSGSHDPNSETDRFVQS